MLDEKSSQKRWIDKQTFRTLRIETHYPDGILAHMVAYTDVTLPAKVSHEDFVPPATSQIKRVSAPVTTSLLHSPTAQAGNALRELGLKAEGSAGFRLVQVASSSLNEAKTAHLLYSDGIETISVFVQNHQNGLPPSLPNDTTQTPWHEIHIGDRQAFENLDGHLDVIVWSKGVYRYTAVSHLGTHALQEFVRSQ